MKLGELFVVFTTSRSQVGGWDVSKIRSSDFSRWECLIIFHLFRIFLLAGNDGQLSSAAKEMVVLNWFLGNILWWFLQSKLGDDFSPQNFGWSWEDSYLFIFPLSAWPSWVLSSGPFKKISRDVYAERFLLLSNVRTFLQTSQNEQTTN